ncbi:g9983 [Coccomyxa elongata]
MKKANLLLASLALVFVYVRAEDAVAEKASNFLLPWDIPSKYVVEAVAGSSCTKYDFDEEHSLDEVQVFIVQAMVHPFSCFGHFLEFFDFSFNATGVASSSAFSPAARLRWMPACRRAGAICEERPVTSKGSQGKAKVKSTAPVSPPAALAPTHTAVGRTPRPRHPCGGASGAPTG